MKTALLVTTALMMGAPAFAADGFGDRFGSNTPYALSDGMDDAIADTQGIGMDDLNDPSALNRIDPAAGEEDAQAQEAQVDAEAEAEVGDEVPAKTESEAQTATETQSETGSAAVEPAAGASADVDAATSEVGTETSVSEDIDANTDVNEDASVEE